MAVTVEVVMTVDVTATVGVVVVVKVSGRRPRREAGARQQLRAGRPR